MGSLLTKQKIERMRIVYLFSDHPNDVTELSNDKVDTF